MPVSRSARRAIGFSECPCGSRVQLEEEPGKQGREDWDSGFFPDGLTIEFLFDIMCPRYSNVSLFVFKF
jgi:hypothetical protein